MKGRTQEDRESRPTRRKPPGKLAKALTRAKHLDDVLDVLGIAPNAWDYLIVSDGSGTTWEKACGWGAVLISRRELSRMGFSGSFSCGTNGIAEMFGVIHPLIYIAEQIKPKLGRPVQIHVLSDAAYIVNQLNCKTAGNKYRELWLAVRHLKYRNYEIVGHWIPRDTIALNQLAHDVANVARVQQETVVKDELRSRRLAKANPD